MADATESSTNAKTRVTIRKREKIEIVIVIKWISMWMVLIKLLIILLIVWYIGDIQNYGCLYAASAPTAEKSCAQYMHKIVSKINQ